jgi:hypothetical protein
VTDGTYFVTPYEISINTFPSPTLQLITCYDTLDDVSAGDTWQVNVASMSDAAASGYFSGRSDALAGYEKVAWLASQSYSGADQQVALQHAIWDVFGTAPADQNTAQDADFSTYENAAQAAATGGYAGFDFTRTVFLEQVGGVPGQPGTEQAFVYRPIAGSAPTLAFAPEPGTWAMLGGGLLLLLVSRWKLSRKERGAAR